MRLGKGLGHVHRKRRHVQSRIQGLQGWLKNCKTEVALPGKGKPGVIVDEPLTGEMIDLPGERVGLDLHAVKPGGALAEYNCEGLEIKATGGVIGEIELCDDGSRQGTDVQLRPQRKRRSAAAVAVDSTSMSEAEQAEERSTGTRTKSSPPVKRRRWRRLSSTASSAVNRKARFPPSRGAGRKRRVKR